MLQITMTDGKVQSTSKRVEFRQTGIVVDLEADGWAFIPFTQILQVRSDKPLNQEDWFQDEEEPS